jgi:hypothetical protein
MSNKFLIYKTGPRINDASLVYRPLILFSCYGFRNAWVGGSIPSCGTILLKV